MFVGYVPTQRTLSLAQARGGRSAALLASTPYDGVLQVAEGSRLLARYTDSFSGDALSAAAVVDPFSLVFDSATGLPLNGASVTVVDVNSGQAATVFSDDGIASFPSTVVSGTSARDGNGRVHTFAPGEFRFPFLRPGSYRFQVDPPAGFSAPSKATDTALQALPGGPFTVISPGSRGEPFVLDPGPAMRVDIPVDPASGALWVQKTASREVAGVGDAVGYEISVTNADKQAPAASVLAVDALPPGFRYRRGSAQRNGSAIADPRTSLDGQVLTFDLGDLPPSGAASVRFLVTVGAGAQVGTVATNVATASSAGGGRSNRAEAASGSATTSSARAASSSAASAPASATRRTASATRAYPGSGSCSRTARFRFPWQGHVPFRGTAARLARGAARSSIPCPKATSPSPARGTTASRAAPSRNSST